MLATITPVAKIALNSDQLNTLISLLFSPFLAIASLTTFTVGFAAFAALAANAGKLGVPTRIDDAIAYGTARAFVVAVVPAIFLLASTISVYA
jgi:hypothetical protein